MQAAAEWIIRQRTLYMKDVPNREDLWVAGLHPPQHIADCAWGRSEWKWYANIDAWYCQGLRRFAEAMAEVDPENAAKYLAESEQYRKALQKAVDRAITLAPVMKVRNGTYRSYIPPIFYIRGPSIGQVIQIAMTDDDWPLELVDSAGIPAADDIRLDGHLDVCEDVLSLSSYVFVRRQSFPVPHRQTARKRAVFRGRLVLGRRFAAIGLQLSGQRLSAPRRGSELPAAMGE